MASNSSSLPLPTLPVELKHEILSFCGRSTLAQTSRVSFAFLELSSPLLCSHVDVHGAEQLDRLLVKRGSFHQAHLSSLLSLDQIKTLTFTESRALVPYPTFPARFDRRAFPYPSPSHSLQKLSIFLDFTSPDGSEAPEGHIFAHDLVSLHLLTVFHPIHLHVEGIPPSRQANVGNVVVDGDGKYPPLLYILGRRINTNLRSLHAQNAMVYFEESVPSLRDVVFELSEDLSEGSWEATRHALWRQVFYKWLVVVEGLEVVIRVRSEERRRELVGHFRRWVGQEKEEAEEKLRRLEFVESTVRLC